VFFGFFIVFPFFVLSCLAFSPFHIVKLLCAIFFVSNNKDCEWIVRFPLLPKFDGPSFPLSLLGQLILNFSSLPSFLCHISPPPPRFFPLWKRGFSSLNFFVEICLIGPSPPFSIFYPAPTPLLQRSLAVTVFSSFYEYLLFFQRCFL